MTAVAYDPFSTRTRANPYPSYAALREQAPVYQLEGPGFYLVSRYEDVLYVVKHPGLFSSKAMQQMMMSGMGAGIQKMDLSQGVDPKAIEALSSLSEGLGFNPVEMMTAPSVIASDPPNHERLRSIVNRGFTPRRISALEPRIRQIAGDALDRMLEKDEFDLVSDFTIPLPVTVIAELLGVESDRFADFKRWSDTLISGSTGSASATSPALLMDTFREFNAYFMEQIERRRRDPKDDLISTLVEAQDGETALTDYEVFMFIFLLLLAGNETTTNLLGNAVDALLAHPEELARVCEDPSLIPALIEETLRYDSPVQQLTRRIDRDVTIHGVDLPPNAEVQLLIGSANRDERQFPDGERFDIFRDTQGHMGFGFGVHFCLGASLARLEAQIALETLLARLPNLRRGSAEIERFDSFLVRGPTSLPLRYDARGA